MHSLEIRVAIDADVAALRVLMAAAIGELQRGFLSEAQIEASRVIMGLDTQLIRTARILWWRRTGFWRGAAAGADGPPCMVAAIRRGGTRLCLTLL